MEIEDIKDTIECRKQIIKYFEYLEGGNELIPLEFVKSVMQKIFTESSAKASSIALNDKMRSLFRDLDLKKITEDEAIELYSKERDLIIKHCILLEIEHNHTRQESIKMNPNFSEKQIIVL